MPDETEGTVLSFHFHPYRKWYARTDPRFLLWGAVDGGKMVEKNRKKFSEGLLKRPLRNVISEKNFFEGVRVKAWAFFIFEKNFWRGL